MPHPSGHLSLLSSLHTGLCWGLKDTCHSWTRAWCLPPNHHTSLLPPHRSLLGAEGYLPFLDQGLGTGGVPTPPTTPNVTRLSRLSLLQTQGEATPPPTAGPSSSSSTTPSSGQEDLLYTLVIAVMLMAIFTLTHVLFNLIYQWVVDDVLPGSLILPGLETQLLCLVLMALTFPDFMSLGPPPVVKAGFVHTRGMAILVVLLLLVPFTIFLWWITLARVLMGPPQYDPPQHDPPQHDLGQADEKEEDRGEPKAQIGDDISAAGSLDRSSDGPAGKGVNPNQRVRCMDCTYSGSFIQSSH